ncbi:MAG: hypothetical protein NWQ29_02540 [Alphaproteobacteria bacterium]|nr:hypothetical protein [Alphaproteobacteria bacterium]
MSFFIEIEVRAGPFTKISVEKSLVAEIMQKVSFTDFEVVVDTWQTGWANSTDDKSLNIIELSVMPEQKRFNAVVAWGDPAKGGVIKKVSGKIQKFMMIPILSAPVGQKTAITESNISYVRFSDDQINPGMALRKEDIIGKFLKAGRSLQFDKPLQLTDLEVPVLIRKGEEVRGKYVDRCLRFRLQRLQKVMAVLVKEFLLKWVRKKRRLFRLPYLRLVKLRLERAYEKSVCINDITDAYRL